MIITYFRSSSFNNFNICQHDYFLTYLLGIPAPSGRAAEKGTIVHKVLECLALAKLAVQNEETVCVDDVLGEIDIEAAIDVENRDYVEELAKRSIVYYTDPAKSVQNHTASDKRDCVRWCFVALDQGDGMFDPRKRTIVAVEPFFDIEIEEDWAAYSYEMPDGSQLEGRLCIKGTVDLVAKGGDDIYEVNDWKTGARKDWATGEEKGYHKLAVDPQLSMYHLALSKLMADDTKHWAMTMNYINKGGPSMVLKTLFVP